jgi:hypothetical protein
VDVPQTAETRALKVEFETRFQAIRADISSSRVDPELNQLCGDLKRAVGNRFIDLPAEIVDSLRTAKVEKPTQQKYLQINSFSDLEAAHNKWQGKAAPAATPFLSKEPSAVAPSKHTDGRRVTFRVVKLVNDALFVAPVLDRNRLAIDHSTGVPNMRLHLRHFAAHARLLNDEETERVQLEAQQKIFVLFQLFGDDVCPAGTEPPLPPFAFSEYLQDVKLELKRLNRFSHRTDGPVKFEGVFNSESAIFTPVEIWTQPLGKLDQDGTETSLNIVRTATSLFGRYLD